MTGHEQYATWDAAYALGALSATERAEFERHLEDCDRCRTAVTELASTVSLLSQVSAEDAQRVADQDAQDARDAGPVRVLAAARDRRRRRRRIGAWAAGIAASVVVATAIAVSALTPRPPEAVALQPVGGAPVAATVALSSVPWGTRLEVTCEYDGYRATGASGEYSLAVVAVDGTTTTLSTWNVIPGATARLSAGTALVASDIQAIEIRDASGDAVVRRELR